MKTKTLFYTLSLLTIVFTMTACSNEDDAAVKSGDNTNVRTWQVSINAGPAQTRAISVGGNDGQTLYYNWDAYDVVEVVKGGASVGTLHANVSEGNSAYAKLDGTLTGTFSVGETVTLYYHTAELDYTEQVGTLAGVSTNKSYLMATSTVKSVDGDNKFLSMSDAAFTPMQDYLELSFTDGNKPINVKSLEIWAEDGKLVKTKAIDGTTTYASEASPLVITPATATNKLFLALRDENGATNKYHFKVTASNGLIYKYEDYKRLENGFFYKGSVTMTVSPEIVGYFLNKDGSITSTKQTSGENQSYAVIAYVGSVPHYFDDFIAIALEDASDGTCSLEGSYSAVNSYADAHPITIDGTEYKTNAAGTDFYDSAYSGLEGKTNSRTGSTIKGWRLPSIADWRYIFEGIGKKAGLTIYSGESYGDPSVTTPTSPTGVCDGGQYYGDDGQGGNLCAAINAACGNTSLQGGNYWCNTGYGMGSYEWNYQFGGGRFNTNENASCSVRAVFAY